ncbi:MAG: hypothetical protein RR500_09215 [Bacilli bacterium]
MLYPMITGNFIYISKIVYMEYLTEPIDKTLLTFPISNVVLLRFKDISLLFSVLLANIIIIIPFVFLFKTNTKLVFLVLEATVILILFKTLFSIVSLCIHLFLKKFINAIYFPLVIILIPVFQILFILIDYSIVFFILFISLIIFFSIFEKALYYKYFVKAYLNIYSPNITSNSFLHLNISSKLNLLKIEILSLTRDKNYINQIIYQSVLFSIIMFLTFQNYNDLLFLYFELGMLLGLNTYSITCLSKDKDLIRIYKAMPVKILNVIHTKALLSIIFSIMLMFFHFMKYKLSVYSIMSIIISIVFVTYMNIFYDYYIANQPDKVFNLKEGKIISIIISIIVILGDLLIKDFSYQLLYDILKMVLIILALMKIKNDWGE